ncbi:DUF2207 domain-containing protein [Microbacterium sp. P05]|uniref:DUF2207 domain-containing protein n=1 Tax=Microbacterium sp. P05 TaxID=3366948 RepID=UPI003746DCCA
MAARTRSLRLLLTLIFATVVAAPFAVGGVAASADTDDFTFDSFHADMSLTRAADGHAEVAITETIVARFPDEDQNRGIVRAIPDDADGVPLHTEILSVTRGDGSDLPYEVDEGGGFIQVATGDDSYVRGVQTYVISYTQRDSIRAYADTGADEFYRDINGTGWQQPFGEVSATIVVDPSLTDALTGDVSCYQGAEGSTDTCTVDERGGPGEARMFYPEAYDLAAEENVSVAIGFEAGTFVPGEVVRSPLETFAAATAPVWTVGSIAAMLASIAAAVAGFVARRRSGDAAGRGLIIAEYDPPKEVTVAQAAHLVGRGAAAVPATIVDLAVRGNLRIVTRGDDTVTLEYVAASDDPQRQKALDAIFEFAAEPGGRVWLGGDTQQVASRLAAYSAGAASDLRAAGLTRKRSQKVSVITLLVVIVAFFVAVASLVFAGFSHTASLLSIVAIPVVVIAGAASVFSWRQRDRVTDAGAPVRDHLIGLREYLELAEADRIQMLQSPDGAERTPDGVVELYEKLLPYAVIWGIEREWAEVLETRVHETRREIDWYTGANGFTSTAFAAALISTRSATNPTAAASSAAWASSGGSSFSGGSMGGGFSGGGMGGGGGGGR